VLLDQAHARVLAVFLREEVGKPRDTRVVEPLQRASTPARGALRPCAATAGVVYSRPVRELPPLRGAWAALAVVVIGAGHAVGQDRPLLTEPASTARAGTLVFETGFDVLASEPSYLTGVERHRWDGPLLRLVYSPADNVELDLEWVARVGVWNEAGREAQGSDWGDVSLRAKWRILAGRPGRPRLAARFGVVLPQTQFEDEQFRPLGLGPNTLRAFVEALLSQPLGPLRLDVNAGLLLHEEVFRPHEQRDFFSYGIAARWAARPAVELVAELNGRSGDGMPGAQQRSEFRLGLRLGSGRLRGDAALRRGLLAADGTWGATLGLAWVARSPGERRGPLILLPCGTRGAPTSGAGR
jgi:hypothetical protein